MKPFNRKEQVAVSVAILAAIGLVISAIMEIQGHSHQESIVLLLNKIIVAAVLFCAVIVYYQRRERVYLLKMYQKMKVNENLLQTAVANSTQLLLFYDLEKDELRIVNHERVYINLPEIIERASETLGTYFLEPEDASAQLDRIFQEVQQMDEYADFDLSLEINKVMRTYQVRIKSIRDRENRIIQCVGAVEDITETMYLKKEVKLREQFLSNMIGFLAVDLHDDTILHVSEKLSTYYEKGMRYTTFMALQREHNIAPSYQKYIEENLSISKLRADYECGKHSIELEYQGYDDEKNPIWRECGIHLDQDWETGHVIAYMVLKNIDADKQKEFLLQEKASRDYLTGLYNRGAGQERIDQFLQEQAAASVEHTHVFLILDLDDFKQLNDTLGHQMGDRALQDVADILRIHFREYDIICRLAGDEFVVLIKNLPYDVIRKNTGILLRKLHLQYQCGQQTVAISASAGVAVWPVHGTNFRELYEKADKALYDAKEKGKKTYEIYNEI